MHLIFCELLEIKTLIMIISHIITFNSFLNIHLKIYVFSSDTSLIN